MNKAPSAFVSRIIDSSAVDGPGNRTTVLFGDCRADRDDGRSPEASGIRSGVESVAHGEMHSGLEDTGRCDGALYGGCGTCSKAGPAGQAAQWMTAGQIAERIAKNRPFIRGITSSGANCTLYEEVLLQLFRLTGRMELTNLIHSGGEYDFFADRALLDSSDGVILDIKAFDPAVYRTLTGEDNMLALQNAVRLASEGLLAEIRTVVIPDLLPNEQTVEGITRTLAPYLRVGRIRYRLILYRPVWRSCGANPTRLPVGHPLMGRLKSIAAKNGFSDIVTQ